MAKDETIRFSLAFFMSCFGMFILAGGTFVGALLLHFSMMESLAGGIIVLVAGALALYYATASKLTHNNFKKWRTVKVISLVVLAIVLAVSAWPTMVMWNFLRSNSDLRNAASSDASIMERQLSEFTLNENTRIRDTFVGIDNAAQMGHPDLSDELRAYLGEEIEVLTEEGVIDAIAAQTARQMFENDVRRIRHGNSDYRDVFTNRIQVLNLVLRTSNPVAYENFAEQIIRYGAEQDSILTVVSGNFNLCPILAGQTSTSFSLGESVPNTYIHTESFMYVNAYDKILHFNWLSFVLWIVSAFLASCYYILTLPTRRKGPQTGSRLSDNLGYAL